MHRSEKADLAEAMTAAEEAFDEALAEKDLDPAYFDLELEGWVLSTHEFDPLTSIVFPADWRTENGDEE